MKSTLLQAAAVSVFALVYPILCAVSFPLSASRAPQPEAAGAEASSEEVNAVPAPEALQAESGASPGPDASTTVRLLDGGEVISLTMDAYLTGVVAAEMPASFEPEALKAQAVAARTYTLYTMRSDPDKHPGADVCSDPACCKAYADDDALRAKWGASYEANIEKITSAVSATDGEYLTYDGEPLLAVFHSSSAGYTEDSGNVWEVSLPYLQSVESPETADDVPNYTATVTVSADDFRETVLRAYPDANLSGACSGWLGTPVYTESGRLRSVPIGGADVSGTRLRSLFSLRSAAMEISAADDNIVFTTTGYGHGVGMSQYGANKLALEGKTCAEILAWYYVGSALAGAA